MHVLKLESSFNLPADVASIVGAKISAPMGCQLSTGHVSELHSMFVGWQQRQQGPCPVLEYAFAGIAAGEA